MSILVIAEHDNIQLNPITLNTLTAASQMGDEIHVLVAGFSCQGIAQAVAEIAGVTGVILADHPAYENFLAENIAPLIVELAEGYSHVVAPATSNGKNILPRVAAMYDVAQVSDITGVVSPDTFKRPIYAGNATATIQSDDCIKVITVRGSSFPPAAGSQSPSPIEVTDKVFISDRVKFVSANTVKSARPDLSVARVVISGGRGMGSGENFALLDTLADKLDAAVGASRAAVDAGYVSNDLQVGQTGKVVAPDLYIAVGISGAIQHLAGMKDSKIIVAINSDEEAPIFRVADYGLVGDLFSLLPELTEKISH